VISVSIVIPVYRSEDCLAALGAAIDQAMRKADSSYELVLVDDASPDGSWRVIKDMARQNSAVKGLRHRHNFGQDNAILTGLRHATGAAVVIMDDDLQHDPEDIPRLQAEMKRTEADVVYAYFSRSRQAWWKKLGSWLNGKVAEWLIAKPSGIYLSPFKLLRREIVELVSMFDGAYPYVDGLILQVTNRLAFVEVAHHDRYAGSSNYTFLKSLQVWSRLAFSFSVKPLRLVTWAGLLTFVLASAGALLVIIYRLTRPDQFTGAVAGWASLMVIVLVLASLQMLSVGILGEYVGRTLININRKPQAIIAETVSLDNRDGIPRTH